MQSAPGTCDACLQIAQKLLSKRQLREALEAFDRAEAIGAAPDECAAGRWTAWMLAGDFQRAWREGDAIRARGGHDPHRLWNGEEIQGKRVMLRCLHGLGDAVQMLRYLPLLRERCATVVVEVPPALLPLARCFRAVDHAITWGKQAPAQQPKWDVQVEVMELPYLFRTSVPDLPIAENYLQVPVALRRQTAHNMGSVRGPRVGIVWAASDWDPTRCLPMECLQHLLVVPGIEFWNLQGGKPYEAGQAEPALRHVRDAAALGTGLQTLAAVIANVDLIITVDTLAAHMAGALGCEAWVLLQHRADWRWMHGRDDSPWYPPLRLFRQAVQDDWHSLTQRVCEALQHWIEGHR